MILVIGRADDPPISLLLEALQAQRARYQFWELRALDRDGLVLGLPDGRLAGRLHLAGQQLQLSDVRAIYARPLAPGTRWSAPDVARQVQQRNQALLDWLDAVHACVLNRPCAMHSNNAKPMQAHWIARAGFAVPDTLVTSSMDDALAFRARHGRVVYKSISGVRSIVRELLDADIGRLALLRHLPVQFQALVPGTDVRVHVVGGSCFAAEIESSAVDYRYVRGEESARLRVLQLPDDVAARCVALARNLGLEFAGIDLRRDAQGGWVCFEVNPMPAYSYYEDQTGLPISAALARYLMEENRHGTGAREPDAVVWPSAELASSSLA